jgi:Hemerythrin HHE cation binding domain
LDTNRHSHTQDIRLMEASMEPNSSAPEQAFLEQLRRRRAELLESMSAVEQALAAPAPGRQARWAERVHLALVELSADFDEHIDITEGSYGLYRELLTTAPRLSGAVARLTREHALIRDLLDNLQARVGEPGINPDVDEVRDRGTVLLGRLVRHRQRGSDLIYEAYTAEIGGET